MINYNPTRIILFGCYLAIMINLIFFDSKIIFYSVFALSLVGISLGIRELIEEFKR